MNDNSMGWLLPAWIIGAPLLFALIDWMRTPKPSRERDDRRDTLRMHEPVAVQR